jgi:protein FLOWERING LOCUS T
MVGIQRSDPLVVGRVIGDVVDPFVRRVPLRVGYASRDVANGCELRPPAIAHQPRVEVGGPDMRTFYTLVSSIYLHTPAVRPYAAIACRSFS